MSVNCQLCGHAAHDEFCKSPCLCGIDMERADDLARRHSMDPYLRTLSRAYRFLRAAQLEESDRRDQEIELVRVATETVESAIVVVAGLSKKIEEMQAAMNTQNLLIWALQKPRHLGSPDLRMP